MKLDVTVLGCGTSAGVPVIGCSCNVCQSVNPRNKRRRCSVLIQSPTTTILVDSGPDLRMQLLDSGIRTIDAILYTHAHADHLHGIDDLRQLNNNAKKAIPAYASEETWAKIRPRFSYALEGGQDDFGGYWRPELVAHTICGAFRIGDLTVEPISQIHGRGTSLGFRIGNFAYSTDVSAFPNHEIEKLKDLKLWIVDALRDKPHPSHAHLNQALEWIDYLKPKMSYLTHMNHEVDYQTWADKLPTHVQPAHDGLCISV